MIGEDLEVTKLEDTFFIDKLSGCNLITRCLSRGVVADCFTRSEYRTNHAIVGSPGIGKSWTLIYALQQALLFENACVMLWFQMDEKAIVCIRRNNFIYAWYIGKQALEGKCYSNLFENSNVLVLLDPRESKDGGAKFSRGARMLIMAASNNEKHFGSVEKFTPGYDRFLSQFAYKELVVALPWMIKNQDKAPSLNDMIKNAKEVGNLPRYILNEESFEKRQKETAIAIKKIAIGDIGDILAFEGLTETKQGPSIPGSIFAVNVQVPISALNVSNNLYQDNEEFTYESAGYDGQLVENYSKYTLKLMSSVVVQSIGKANRRTILSFWNKLSGDGS
jgi:hypothetical protein